MQKIGVQLMVRYAQEKKKKNLDSTVVTIGTRKKVDMCLRRRVIEVVTVQKEGISCGREMKKENPTSNSHRNYDFPKRAAALICGSDWDCSWCNSSNRCTCCWVRH